MIGNKNREPFPPVCGNDSRDAFRFHFPSRPRRVALKDKSQLIITGSLTRFAPCRAMPDNPIRQRLLKTDVASGFFRLNPFVPENFFAFSLKLAIKRGVFQ